MMRLQVPLVGFVALGLVVMPLALHSQTGQENFWKSYVEACDPTSFVNKHAYFFGATNTYGPGSTFGLRGGTTNPIALANTYFGTTQPAVVAGKTADCTATGSRMWSVTLGVPVTLTASKDAVDLSATLSSASSITVSIKSVATDTIPLADWEDAADKLDHAAHAFTDVIDGSHYVMSAAVAVEGITIVYSLNRAVSAGLTAQVNAKAIDIGTSANPAKVQVTISPDGRMVTLESKERVYLLGQLLKIRKIPQSQVNPSTGPKPRISVDTIGQ